MNNLRIQTIWFALIAFCFAILAPTVSSAVPADSNNALEICSSFGIRKIEFGSKNSPADKHVDRTMHCPFCLHHVQDALPLPEPAAMPQVAEFSGVALTPDLFLPDSHDLRLFSQARAPPPYSAAPPV